MTHNQSIFHYQSSIYDTKQRFCSYWHQINEIRKIDPESILEIGIGSGFLSRYLKKLGFKLTTADIDATLRPDIVASITSLPIASTQFDLVACFELLEHLHFDYFIESLKELTRITRKWVILSLPDATRSISLMFRSTGVPYGNLIITIPHLFKKEQKYQGEHYWEIGKNYYSLNKIKDQFGKAGLKLMYSYRVPEHLYHRFFILEKLT